MTCGEAGQIRRRICINSNDGLTGCDGNNTESSVCSFEVR